MYSFAAATSGRSSTTLETAHEARCTGASADGLAPNTTKHLRCGGRKGAGLLRVVAPRSQFLLVASTQRDSGQVVFQEHNGCVEYGHIRRCNNHSRHFLGEHFHSGCCSEAPPPKANLQLASHMVDHVVIDRSVAKCVPSFVLVRDQTAHYTGRASQI